MDLQKKRQLLQGIKGYRTHIYSIDTISNVVPHLIADLFRTFFVSDNLGRPRWIGYDWGRLMEFQVNLGSVIASGNFDYLDNIILQFLHGYSCLVFPHKFNIKFSNDAKEKYSKICNRFKGLGWDDIIDEFIDSTFELFESGTIHNKQVEVE